MMIKIIFFHGIMVILLSVAALPVPPCRTITTPSYGPLPRGVLSVEHFGADPSGLNDSTASLQRALDTARTDNITLFVPLGCYTITDALNATEPRNGRWQPIVIVGDQSNHSHRPMFVLPPHTKGFHNQNKSRPVITFWTDWCLAPGPKKNKREVDEWCSSGKTKSFTPYVFNQVFQGIDILIGEGNPGAVGIVMLAAQGSTLQDVTVYAASDALAGVHGGNGGGGSFVGLRVVGAKYGIDMRRTAGFATLVTITLLNQTCAGIVVGSEPGGPEHSRGTLTATGLYVEGNPELGGMIAGINLPNKNDKCWAPNIPGGWGQPPSSAKTKALPPSVALNDAVSLIDSSFNVSGAACLVVNSSLYISNSYAFGCPNIIVAGGRVISHWKENTYSRLSLVAIGRQDFTGISSKPYSYSFPIDINGKQSKNPLINVDTVSALPVGLQSRHHWGNSAPDWQSTGAVNALDIGAKGDGIADDWKALQAAVNNHKIVILPKGLYRLSQPLILRKHGAALIGVGNTRSFLIPLRTGFSGNNKPVLHVISKDATVKSLSIITWDHLDLFALLWDGDGTWRQSFSNREHEASFPPFFELESRHIPPETTPTNYSRPLQVISGGGAFYDFNLDFGCCFGTVLPPPSVHVGPDIASTGGIVLQQPLYRSLLVNGSKVGLRFYPHNMEQDFGDAHTEIRDSTNVTMYGAKSEGNHVAIWIRDSDLITLYGYGGNASPFPATFIPKPGFTQLMPSLFRVQRSTRVILANLNNNERITSASHPSTLVAAGDGFDPRVWHMVLRQDSDTMCDPIKNPKKCTTTAFLERPVLWRWDGA